MKFLDPRFNGRNLMPINVISYDAFELGARDALAVTFKDMDTNQIFVETIEKPKYEVYVLKREFWEQKKDYMDCWEHQSNLVKHTISYKYRDQELAKILGCQPDKVKYSPFIFGYDIKVEHFYWIHFLLEYGNDLPKEINKAFFDIESDIIQCDGFASPGEAPTSAITIIDGTNKTCYTLLLAKDNIPILAETNPRYEEFQKVREFFYQQVDDFREHLGDFIQELHNDFDESYGSFEYVIMMFEDEIKLHETFWQIVRSLNIDIMLAWNAPYDVRNLIERPLVLGKDPESIICDPAYYYKVCFFEEDENIVPHKRNHRVCISIKPLILCQMWGYAGVRAAQGKQSLKLTAVAQKEIKDEKLNYEEEGSIKTFMYRNYRKFVKYNIKDVLLQYGIENRVKDVDSIYDRAYDNGILLPEAFVSTTLLTNSMTMDFLSDGFVIGTNANRIMEPFNYKAFISDEKDIYSDPTASLPDNYPFEDEPDIGGLPDEGWEEMDESAFYDTDDE